MNVDKFIEAVRAMRGSMTPDGEIVLLVKGVAYPLNTIKLEGPDGPTGDLYLSNEEQDRDTIKS